MNAWIVVLVAGVVTYLLRVSMILASDRLRMASRLAGTAALVAPAAFAALAATGTADSVLGAGGLDGLAPIAAVSMAALAAARTGSRFSAVLVGMPTLWGVTALIHA
jgi:branched-subunit amino acid transport protein